MDFIQIKNQSLPEVGASKGDRTAGEGTAVPWDLPAASKGSSNERYPRRNGVLTCLIYDTASCRELSFHYGCTVNGCLPKKLIFAPIWLNMALFFFTQFMCNIYHSKSEKYYVLFVFRILRVYVFRDLGVLI